MEPHTQPDGGPAAKPGGGARGNKPALSVIIPPGGRRRDRRALTAALRRQSLRDLEAIAAPQPHADGDGPRSFSPGSALNLAVAAAHAPLLAFVDPALVPQPDWAEQIVHWFAVRPECAAVSGTALRKGKPVLPEQAPLHCAVRAGAFARSRGFDDLVPCEGGRQAELTRALAAAGAVPDHSDEIVAQLRGVPAVAGLLPSGRGRHSPLVGRPSPSLVPAPGSPRVPVASIVMPAWGRPQWAETCLVALLRQDFPEAYEVIVPTDPGGAMERIIRARYPGVRTCACSPAAGPGGARNSGMDAARGEYVAFLDGDCLPERDWLWRIVSRCRTRQGAPVSGWLVTAYPHSWVALADNALEQGTVRPARAAAEAGLSGCNMCIGRALAAECGARFAEGVFGAEDVALLGSLPAWARPAVLDPEARTLHLRRDTFRGALAHQFAIGRGSGHLRRVRPMRGSALASRNWAAPLLVPTRLALMLLRAVESGPSRVLGLALLSPLILVGLLAYSAGFMSGAARAGRGSGP